MEESLDDLCTYKKTATNIIPDLIVLDQNQRELERLNRRLSSLKALIGGKGIFSAFYDLSNTLCSG